MIFFVFSLASACATLQQLATGTSYFMYVVAILGDEDTELGQRTRLLGRCFPIFFRRRNVHYELFGIVMFKHRVAGCTPLPSLASTHAPNQQPDESRPSIAYSEAPTIRLHPLFSLHTLGNRVLALPCSALPCPPREGPPHEIAGPCQHAPVRCQAQDRRPSSAACSTERP